jgi:hypothetical protein
LPERKLYSQEGALWLLLTRNCVAVMEAVVGITMSHPNIVQVRAGFSSFLFLNVIVYKLKLG